MKVTKPRSLRRTVGIALVASASPWFAQAAPITWDATYFNDVGLSPADFATFQSELEIAMDYYSSTWEAPFPVTVKIHFRAVNTGLGTSITYGNSITYQEYRSVLASTGTSADDAMILSLLPDTPGNPVNGSTEFGMSLPLMRAMGYDFFPPGDDPDSEILLNTDLMTLGRVGPMIPGSYDLRQVAYHEINEVLGFLSGLNGVPNMPGPGPTGAIQAADLFRYDAPGSRSWNTDINAAQPYLSIDNGVTKLAEFDVDDQGDRQDFDGMFDGKPFYNVQDAFSTPELRLDNALPEETFLDAMGYNRIAGGLLGDMNCDGVVSVSDIGGFVLALTDPAGYAVQFPNCNINNGDINGDTSVSVSDIGPFVALLTGGLQSTYVAHNEISRPLSVDGQRVEREHADVRAISGVNPAR